MIVPSGVSKRVAAASLALLVSLTALSGCATRTGGAATPSPTPTSSESVTPTPTASPSVTPSPAPTAGEIAPVPTPVPTPTAGAGDVEVVFITLDVVGSKLEATGIIPSVVEDGGECTLTLTRGADTRSVSGAAAAGPQSTYCGLLTVPAAQLARGEWAATLTYRSAAHSGVTATQTVSVP